MAKKKAKISDKIKQEYCLQVHGESVDKSNKVSLMFGDEKLGDFYSENPLESNYVFTSTQGNNLRLVKDNPDFTRAVLYFRGFNNGAGRGRISLAYLGEISE